MKGEINKFGELELYPVNQDVKRSDFQVETNSSN